MNSPGFLSEGILAKLLNHALEGHTQFLLVPQKWRDYFDRFSQDQVQGRCAFWEGDYLEDGAFSPLFPFGEMIRQEYLGFTPQQKSAFFPPAFQKHPLAEVFLSYLAKAKLTGRNPGSTTLLASKVSGPIFWRFGALLWEKIQKKPLVVFLDNLDAADDLLLQFLVRLLEQENDLPHLFVGFFRWQYRKPGAFSGPGSALCRGQPDGYAL
jgi:hypothetical protein